MLLAASRAALRREGGAAGAGKAAAGGGEPPSGGEQRGEPPTGGVQPGEPPTGGVQPDIVVLEGWPETANPPEGPTTTWVSQEGERRAVSRVRIGELACTSDFQPHNKTVARKREKYRLLVIALRGAGG